jgi:O-antigen ligase/polysaccharide polymerase Wzy-like membrane protein
VRRGNLAIKKIKFSSVGVFLFILVPFSYLELYGIRIIAIGPLALLGSIIVLSKYKLKLTVEFAPYLVLFVYICFLCLVSGSSVILALAIFFVYSIWPAFISRRDLNIGLQLKIIKVYIYGALFCAIGVVVQRSIFEVFGIELGKIDRYGGNRIGFGFIWLDYSYLSLFLVSAIPLFFSINNSSLIFRYLGILVLVVGSLVTTARTGVVSLIIIMWIYSLYVLGSRLLTNRLNFGALAIILGSVVILAFGYFYASNISSRDWSASGSGRIEGYVMAFEYVSQNPFFGTMFSPELYKSIVGVIPHNLFLYIAAMGGVFSLFMILAWLALLGVSLLKNSVPIKLSLFIVFIGLQFVPSIFSAYFVAALVSISLFERLRFKYIEL